MSHLPLRADLAGLEPYGAPQLHVPVVLNVNENPYPPDPEMIADIAHRVAAAASSLNRYPDRDFYELRDGLAQYLTEESGVAIVADDVWAANGSNEIMLHILQAFGGPGRTMLTFTPSYSMYPEYATDTFTTFVAGKRTEEYAIDMSEVRSQLATHAPSVMILASPNNPTGTALDPVQLKEILQATQRSGPAGTATIVVVDEAYGEFRRDGIPSALELVADNPHLVVTRTMSKAFGAAGLRLGYMVAGREILDQIKLIRLPYHLSAVTQAAALGALAHRSHLKAQVTHLREARDQLAEDIRALGLSVPASDANFVFFGTFADRHAVWQELLDQGILIREVGPDGWLRVSVGTDQENAIFLSALKEIVER